MSNSAYAQASPGSEIAAQLGRTSGTARYDILYSLKSAGRVAKGLTAADLNAVIAGMEDQRASVVKLMRYHLAPNLTAADMVALSGRTTGSARYGIISDLKSAGRVAKGLTAADLNAVIAGMEDQRPRVVKLMRYHLEPNLTAADVVALSGQTTGSARYGILYDLKSAGRLAKGLTVSDLNTIVAGMEEKRVEVVKLLRYHLTKDLAAADVTVASGNRSLPVIGSGTGSNPATGSGSPASPPAPGLLGGCGSTKWQRLAVPEYVCFSPYGGTLPWVNLCVVASTTGYLPVYMGEACRMHDGCYGTSGARKSRCDTSFHELIVSTCDATLEGALWAIGRRNCHNVASEYYHQVSTKGCEAFRAGQQAVGVEQPVCN